jgi:hypothetical protein
MKSDAATLPDSVDELKTIIVDFAQRTQEYETEIRLLKEENNLLKHRLFGRKSEKLPIGSGQLFLVCPAWAITWRWKSAMNLAVGIISQRQGCRG